MSLPVAGFLPLRSSFCFTQNLPKPLIRTSSPDSRVFLMSSRRVSIVSVAILRVIPMWLVRVDIMSAFVSDPGLFFGMGGSCLFWNLAVMINLIYDLKYIANIILNCIIQQIIKIQPSPPFNFINRNNKPRQLRL
jgi:hypothetical protein